MQEKIELYKEMLVIDPFSKVFYLLAVELRKQGEEEQALHYLEKGIMMHPDFLEAKMFYVDICTKLGLHERSAEQMRSITETLEKYPYFWNTWSSAMKKSNKDASMAMGFLAMNFAGSTVSWTDILHEGVESITEKNALFTLDKKVLRTAQLQESSQSFEDTQRCEATMDTIAEEDAHVPVVYTRSMADLLAEQGEIEEAIAVYKVLLEEAPDEKTQQELHSLIMGFEEQLAMMALHSDSQNQQHSEKREGSSAKEKLIGTLAALVERLDQRAQAQYDQV